MPKPGCSPGRPTRPKPRSAATRPARESPAFEFRLLLLQESEDRALEVPGAAGVALGDALRGECLRQRGLLGIAGELAEQAVGDGRAAGEAFGERHGLCGERLVLDDAADQAPIRRLFGGD